MTALTCLAILGCTSVPKTVYERPLCAPAELAVLPIITADEMECLPRGVYWRLKDRERRITDWALENEAIVERLCDAP